MKRLIVGAIAVAAVVCALAGTAWATHGGDAEPPGMDIVQQNANGEDSTGGYSIDPDTGAKRAFVRVALAATSLKPGLYRVLLYDSDGDTTPIAGEVMNGDGVSTALDFDGKRDADRDGQGDGIKVDKATDNVIFVCAVTSLRGEVRDLAGYDAQGRCTTTAGAMELGAGLPPGGAGSFG